jgi:hypothetical protein
MRLQMAAVSRLVPLGDELAAITDKKSALAEIFETAGRRRRSHQLRTLLGGGHRQRHGPLSCKHEGMSVLGKTLSRHIHEASRRE